MKKSSIILKKPIDKKKCPCYNEYKFKGIEQNRCNGRKDEVIMKEAGYTIRCGCHTYMTLEFEGKFIFCLDNDLLYAEEMIYKIEKRTGMNFQDIPIEGRKDDFQGLRFFRGGWKRDFWGEFPDKKEIESYMKLKNGVM